MQRQTSKARETEQKQSPTYYEACALIIGLRAARRGNDPRRVCLRDTLPDKTRDFARGEDEPRVLFELDMLLHRHELQSIHHHITVRAGI